MVKEEFKTWLLSLPPYKIVGISMPWIDEQCPLETYKEATTNLHCIVGTIEYMIGGETFETPQDLQQFIIEIDSLGHKHITKEEALLVLERCN